MGSGLGVDVGPASKVTVRLHQSECYLVLRDNTRQRYGLIVRPLTTYLGGHW